MIGAGRRPALLRRREEIEQHAEDHVEREELHAFEPVALAVGCDHERRDRAQRFLFNAAENQSLFTAAGARGAGAALRGLPTEAARGAPGPP